jgi:hypothetical protein
MRFNVDRVALRVKGSHFGHFAGTLGKAPYDAGFGPCEHSYPQSHTQIPGATWDAASAKFGNSSKVHFLYHRNFPH